MEKNKGLRMNLKFIKGMLFMISIPMVLLNVSCSHQKERAKEFAHQYENSKAPDDERSGTAQTPSPKGQKASSYVFRNDR